MALTGWRAAEALVGFRGIVPERLPSGELPKAKRQTMLNGPCPGPQANEAGVFRESTGFEKQLAPLQKGKPLSQ